MLNIQEKNTQCFFWVTILQIGGSTLVQLCKVAQNEVRGQKILRRPKEHLK